MEDIRLKSAIQCEMSLGKRYWMNPNFAGTLNEKSKHFVLSYEESFPIV